MIDSIPGIDYRFSDPRLLVEALTHRSHGDVHYERLEFLGDSVLNFVVSQQLYQHYPDAAEGDLSRMRARIVRGRTLADLAESLQLGKYLRLGGGERRSGTFRRSSILGDALEALLGAILLDGGFDACRQVIMRLIHPLIQSMPAAEQLKDSKTRLQEWLQARGRPLPEYRLLDEQGADHAKQFTVECRLVDSGDSATARGSSQRKAQQAAAGELLQQLAP